LLDESLVEPAQATVPLPAQRILLLARGGPLILEVQLTIAGAPFQEPFTALVEQVLSAGDTDGDGQATWQEWSANTPFFQGKLAALPKLNQRTIDQWVERYDWNQDNQIQPPEAAAWLGRQGGQSAAAFSLRSSRSFATRPATRSRLWQLLDSHSDGRLSAEELTDVSQQLLQLDADDSRTLEPAELTPLESLLEAEAQDRRSLSDPSARPAAVYLVDQLEINRLDYVLSDLYSPRQQLATSSFPDRKRLSQTLDINQDQWLSPAELQALANVPPHVQVALNFPATDSGPLELRLLDFSSAELQVTQLCADRLLLETPDTSFILSAHDLSDQLGPEQTAQKNQVRLLVHDRVDSLFVALDTNANGRLEERELAGASKRLRQEDRNQDGQLSEEEIKYTLIVALVKGESQQERSFYLPQQSRAQVEDPATPDWFRQADYNQDGELSLREFLGTAEQFSALDQNNDQFLSSDEARSARSP
jgi:Ca2+-binding EF-hand superfamily protein